MTTDKGSQFFRYWVLSALGILFFLLLWAIRDLIGPLVIAALLAYILNPLVDLLTQRTRFSRPLAITFVFLTGLGLLAALSTLMFPVLLTEIQTLSSDLNTGLSRAEDFLSQPVKILQWEIHLEGLLQDPGGFLSQQFTALPENVYRLIESTTSNLIWFLVIVVTTYYLLRDWAHLRDWLLSLTPEPYQPATQRIYQEIKQVWMGYLRGNLVLMAIVGVVFSLAWWVIGLPGALILGIIAGVLTIIPDLGPAIAAALAVVVALLEGSTYLPISNFWFAVLVIGIYLLLVNIKSIWVRPRIYGHSVHMHDGIIFVAIMAAVVLQGILGALIVVPVLASMVVIGRYVYRWLLGRPLWPEEVEDLPDGKT